MTEYMLSGKMGSGRSRRYFFNRTAARWGSPNVSSDTTLPVTKGEMREINGFQRGYGLPRSYASCADLSITD